MCQKFLPKIKNGDKRVFIINGKVCGAISRVPKKGSFLSNMSKGAKPVNTNLTRNEKKISNIVGKDLKKKNIFFSFLVKLILTGLAPLLILLKNEPFLGILDIAPHTLPLIMNTLLSPYLILSLIHI